MERTRGGDMSLLSRLLSMVPDPLRHEVRGYCASVRDAMPEIFSGVHVRITPELQNRFLMYSALRRMWQMIDSQYWTMANCLSLISDYGVGDVVVGQTKFSKESAAFEDTGALRNELEVLLAKYGPPGVVYAPTLGDVARLLSEESSE